jgi:HTH-type transcriptional regulator, competence development regulator
MKSKFGEHIRDLRIRQNLYLRQVAPLLQMDTAQLSKIEKGLRQLKREHISIIADVLNTNSNELLILWLADQIYDLVKDEQLAKEAMQLAGENINRNKTQA